MVLQIVGRVVSCYELLTLINLVLLNHLLSISLENQHFEAKMLAHADA